MKIIIFHTNIIEIGGVETFTYNMCKSLSEIYDVELIYKTCHPSQLKRLQRICKCGVYDPNKDYECDFCLIACAWGGYPEKVKAKEYIQIVHANYKELLKIGYKYEGWDKTTKHIAVSNCVAKHFYDLYNIKADVVYNILDEIQPTKPILKLVSATRLSYEKGYKRMVMLANELKKRGIKFRWTIFTNRDTYNIGSEMDMEEVIFMKPRYDIFDYIKEADYGVQLSDTEGYSYFLNECLQYGTGLIATNFDSLFESWQDDKSGSVLPFELFEKGTKEDWDKAINKILKVPKKFKYEPKTTIEKWIGVLGEPGKKDNYVYEEPKTIKVRVLKRYKDIKLNRSLNENEVLEMDEERVEFLKGKGLVEYEKKNKS